MENTKKKCGKKPLKKQKKEATNGNVKGIQQKAYSSILPKNQQNVLQPETKALSKTTSENITKKGVQHNSFTMLYPKEPKKLTITVVKEVKKTTGHSSKYLDRSKKKQIPKAKVQAKWK